MKKIISRALTVLLAFAIVSGFAACTRYDKETEQGLAYIKGLEQQDPATVEQTLKNRAKERRAAEREERLAQLKSGEVSVWTLFEDYFILGDSRAAEFVGLSDLDESRVFGQYGATINTIPDELYRAKEKNPAYLFLVFGLNDIRWWDTPEEFVAVYRERLAYVREQMPDTKIFVNCIFPCTGAAFDKYSVWRKAPEYNEALREMVAQTDCCFVGCDDIESFDGYWRKDGIHFTEEFYRLWGADMLMAVYDAEDAAQTDID